MAKAYIALGYYYLYGIRRFSHTGCIIMSYWYCSSVAYASVAQWANNITYAVGNIVRQLAAPAIPYTENRCFRVSSITTGISGGSEPAWTLTHNGTTTDSGVTW